VKFNRVDAATAVLFLM